MPVKSIAIRNYRAFVDVPPLELGRINVLIGPNNGGKSSLISALYLMQIGSDSNTRDVRVASGNPQAEIDVRLADVAEIRAWNADDADVTLSMKLRPGAFEMKLGPNRSVQQLPGTEPHHFIVPYLSRRKVTSYDQTVSRPAAMAIEPTFQRLAARLARLSNPAFPGHDRYSTACEDILGFVVTAIPSDNGQEPGVFVSRDETIPLARMGEGVPNIVGLLVDLALYEGKLFLMEEIENDLHPLALKSLLRMILESAATHHNQFVVSTHSNVVARHLGSAEGAKLFYVSSRDRSIPHTRRSMRSDLTQWNGSTFCESWDMS